MKGHPDRKLPSRRKCQRRKEFFVPEWRQAHHWLSVQIPATAAGLGSLYEFVPGTKQWLPDSLFHWMMVVVALGAILGRVYQQKPKV